MSVCSGWGIKSVNAHYKYINSQSVKAHKVEGYLLASHKCVNAHYKCINSQSVKVHQVEGYLLASHHRKAIINEAQVSYLFLKQCSEC